MKDRHHGFYTKSFVKVPKNKICLWYSWPAGRNQHQNKNNGRRYKYIVLPNYLLLDKLTLNALGLLEAEMTKHSKRASNTTFTNGEPKLNNTIFNFFKRFNIKPEDWSWSITFNFKLRDKETLDTTKKREIIAEQFWLKNTLINLEKKRTKYIEYSGNKNYKNIGKNTNLLGNLRINYSDIIIYQLIFKILQRIKNTLLTNQDYIKYYLQGLIAGEGSIHLTKYKSIDNVNIGGTNIKEKKFYSKCLAKLGMTSKIEKNCVVIHNQKNFLKVFKKDLFRLHPKKSSKFVKGMLNFRQIPGDLKKEFLVLKESFNNELINLKPIIKNYEKYINGINKMV